MKYLKVSELGVHERQLQIESNPGSKKHRNEVTLASIALSAGVHSRKKNWVTLTTDEQARMRSAENLAVSLVEPTLDINASKGNPRGYVFSPYETGLIEEGLEHLSSITKYEIRNAIRNKADSVKSVMARLSLYFAATNESYELFAQRERQRH